MAKCEACGLDLTKWGPRHRCTTGKIEGQKPLTRLQKDQLDKGQLDPATLATPPATATPATPIGRLAPRQAADVRPLPQPRQPQPTNADILEAIAEIRKLVQEMRSDLTKLLDRP